MRRHFIYRANPNDSGLTALVLNGEYAEAAFLLDMLESPEKYGKANSPSLDRSLELDASATSELVRVAREAGLIEPSSTGDPNEPPYDISADGRTYLEAWQARESKQGNWRVWGNSILELQPDYPRGEPPTAAAMLQEIKRRSP